MKFVIPVLRTHKETQIVSGVTQNPSTSRHRGQLREHEAGLDMHWQPQMTREQGAPVGSRSPNDTA